MISKGSLEVLRRTVEALAGGPLPDWEGVAATVVEHRLRPGDTLVQGERQGRAPHATDFYLVIDGALQVKVVDTSGASQTVNFASTGDLMATQPAVAGGGANPELAGTLPFTAFLKGAARARSETYVMVALTRTTVVQLDGASLASLADTSLPWAKVFATAYRLYALFMRRERDRMRLSPERRYRSFLRDYGDIQRAIPQKMIADYLGISEVGMSRIVARVRKEQTHEQAPEQAEPQEQPPNLAGG